MTTARLIADVAVPLFRSFMAMPPRRSMIRLRLPLFLDFTARFRLEQIAMNMMSCALGFAHFRRNRKRIPHLAMRFVGMTDASQKDEGLLLFLTEQAVAA